MSVNTKVTVTVAPPSEDPNEVSMFWLDHWNKDVGHIRGIHFQWELSSESRRYWRIANVTGPGPEHKPLSEAYPGVFGELRNYGDGGKFITDENKDPGTYPYDLFIESKTNGPNAVASKDGSATIDIDPTIRNGGSDD